MFTTSEDYKAMIDCSYKIGNSTVNEKRTNLSESSEKKPNNIFESIGDSEKPKEPIKIKYIDAVKAKYSLGKN
ncbi:MAG: hypothetical protein M0R17_00595 [Candidatus Omnitrophica bacterium]|jgi:hypothetical protein|nr:hypothetical protein [Candidatus Omnitrophota bacterium]